MDKTTIKAALAALGAAACLAATAAVDDSNWKSGPSDEWFVNWDKALAEAKKTKKPLFVLNTGSTWCHWCKKLRQEVLDDQKFKDYAKNKLVLLYLDSPCENKAQSDHNRSVVKVLGFGGGVPCAMVVDAKGKLLGTMRGGGQTADAYVAELKKFKRGNRIDSAEAKTLFGAGGYEALAKKIADERAALPPATKDDFKMKLTGVAVVDDHRRKEYWKGAKFSPPEKEVKVPFGKVAVFRVEYDFPKGYGARVWTRDGLCADGKRHAYNFGSNPSGIYKGKGVAYGFLTLLERGEACDLVELEMSTNSEPELDGTRSWTVGTCKVDVKFAKADKSGK